MSIRRYLSLLTYGFTVASRVFSATARQLLLFSWRLAVLTQ